MRAAPTTSARRSRIESAAALLLLLVPPLVVLWPAVFGGQAMSPSGYLANWVPWKGASPLDPSLGNPLLSDVPLAIDPWLSFARSSIRDGVLPLWNPWTLSGTPFYSNPQAAIFSPFNVPIWLLSFSAGVATAALLKLWVAAIGSWLLAREFGCSKATALVAGIAFSLCSFNVVWLGHAAHVSVNALLPLALVFTERLIRRGRRRDFAGLWITVGVALLGGHPGSELHLLFGVFLWAAVRIASLQVDRRGDRLRPVGLVGLGLAAGAASAGFLLVPIEAAAPGTLGEVARQGGGLGLPLRGLVTTLFPDLWGRPVGAVGSQIHFHVPKLTSDNFNERTVHAGAVTLMLAFIGAASTGRVRKRLPLFVFAAVGLAVPFDFLGLGSALGALPLFGNATNSRLTVWFELSAAVFAAVGLQAVVERKVSPRRIAVAVGLCWLAVLIALAVELPGSGGFRPAISWLLHGSPQTGHHARVAVAAVVVAGALLLTAGVALLLSGRIPARVLIAVLVTLVAVDAVHFAHGYQPIGPVEKVEPGVTPAIAFLQRHSSEGRIAGLGSSLVHDYGLKFGLRDARGQDAPQPLLRYVRLWERAGEVGGGFRLYLGRTVDPEGIAVLRLLGVKWIVAPPRTRPADVSGLGVAYSGRDARVFEVPSPAAEAFVARNVLSAGDTWSALRAIRRPGFDPARDAVVERARSVAVKTNGASGTARVTGRGNSSVTLSATATKGAVVVLDDALTDGWKVEVDGRSAQPLLANVVMRGVAIPPGRHTIRWTYSVPGLPLGIAVSALGVLLGLLGIAACGRRRPAGSAGGMAARIEGDD